MSKSIRAHLTSITDTASRAFISNDSNGHAKELACEKISGFHLQKTINRKGSFGTWRFRYTNASSKVRVITLGKFTSMTPAQASSIAASHRANVNEGIDPLAVIDERKEEQRRKAQEDESRKFRTIRQYLDGPYTNHQSQKIDSGKHTLNIIRGAFTKSKNTHDIKKYDGLLDRDMDSLGKADVIEWQQTMYFEGYAHSTVTRAYGALKTMFNHATEHGYIKFNPLTKVKLNSPPDKEQERLTGEGSFDKRRMLTPAELKDIQTGLNQYAEEIRAQRRNSRVHGKPHLADLDNVAYPHWAIPFSLLAMHTGLRPGDIRTLTWQELNLLFKRLTKTPRKTRHHPDPIQVRQSLNDIILEIMTSWNHQQGSPTTGLVFPSPRTGEELDKKAYVRHWKSILAHGKVQDLDFYALRHHFISSLVAEGVPLLTVAHLAGHKSTAMIERHYGHLAPDHAANALNMFSQTLYGSRDPSPKTRPNN